LGCIEYSKKCFDCGQIKHLSEFPPQKENKDGFKGNCKKCNTIRSQTHLEISPKRQLSLLTKKKTRDDIHDWVMFLKLESGCVECGYCEDHRALQVHHVVGPKLTSFDSGCSLEKMKGELEKIIILCANCHKILHAKEYEKGIRNFGRINQHI